MCKVCWVTAATPRFLHHDVLCTLQKAGKPSATEGRNRPAPLPALSAVVLCSASSEITIVIVVNIIHIDDSTLSAIDDTGGFQRRLFSLVPIISFSLQPQPLVSSIASVVRWFYERLCDGYHFTTSSATFRAPTISPAGIAGKRGERTTCCSTIASSPICYWICSLQERRSWTVFELCWVRRFVCKRTLSA